MFINPFFFKLVYLAKSKLRRKKVKVKNPEPLRSGLTVVKEKKETYISKLKSRF